jgi:hypothetical protein
VTAGLALIASLILVPHSAQVAEAWPSGCNASTSYWTSSNGQVPEAPGASAAGWYTNTCGGFMQTCSGGSWSKGQWLVTSGVGVRHFTTSNSCFTLSPGVTYSNTRMQCADYTGGNNYASCHQRFVW